MMASPLYYLVLLVLGVGVIEINGQDLCRPRPVQNLDLNEEALLTWESSPLEICRVIHYLIHILIGATDEILYINNVTSLDVSFLPICATTRFTIVPVTDANVQGTTVALVTTIPPPLDMEMSLTTFSMSQGDNNVTLHWSVTEQWRRCALQFRVLIYNEEDNIPIDIYTRETSQTLTSLIPCTSYTFGVTPVYHADREGHPSIIRYSSPRAKIAPPTLQSITIGSTTADLIWDLQRATVNRCAVSSLRIDASPSFTISYPIADQYNRPPVRVRLTNLQPDTMYVLRVAVDNTAGPSDPSILGLQTLRTN